MLVEFAGRDLSALRDMSADGLARCTERPRSDRLRCALHRPLRERLKSKDQMIEVLAVDRGIERLAGRVNPLPDLDTLGPASQGLRRIGAGLDGRGGQRSGSVWQGLSGKTPDERPGGLRLLA